MWISPGIRPLLTTDNPNSDTGPGLDRPVRTVPGWSRSSLATAPRHSAIPLTGPWSTTRSLWSAGRTVTDATAAGPSRAGSSPYPARRERIRDETGTLQHHLPGPLVSRRGPSAPADDRQGQEIRIRRHRDRRQAAARQSARLADAPDAASCVPVADGEGIEIFAVAANNDFSNPVPEVREAQICFVRDLIRMTADLGAPTLRVSSWPGGASRGTRNWPPTTSPRGYWPIVHEKFSTEEIWGWCREALVECARYAGDAGVTLALQNHKPLINDHNDVLRMVNEVDSPHLKVCLDAPLMPDKSAAAIRRGGPSGRPAPGAVALRRRIRAPARRVDSWLSTAYDGVVEGRDEPVLPRLRPRHERDRLRWLHRLRAVPPIARGRWPDGRDRIRRSERPAGGRVHARA